MSIILQPEELTKGERLFLNRRRKGLTWYQAAEFWKVPGKRYRLWESDAVDNAPSVNVPNLEPREECIIQRRRFKITQERLGKELNLSRAWINAMENESADPARLVFFWTRLKGNKPAIAK